MKKTWIYAASCALALLSACHHSDSQPVPAQSSSKLLFHIPFRMEEVIRPVFDSCEVNIIDCGAKSGGVELNTEAINRAIKKVSKRGGGKVIIPAGLWLTGPIELLSNVNLHTEKNALVVFTSDHSQYPIIPTTYEGWETRRCQSPISARNAENIAITGEGIFDGGGDSWRPVKKNKLTASQWDNLLESGGVTNEKGDTWFPSESGRNGYMNAHKFQQGEAADEEWESVRDFLRPVMISLIQCKKVLLEGVTFKNSPAWCIHPLMCEDLTLDRISVSNPWYSQNGDALDLESCSKVLVARCTFDAGDDAICLKSGKDEEGRRRGVPCENIVIKDCVVLHGHGGFVVGSEMSGGIRNIFVENCTFLGTDVGLRFKSKRGRGGKVEDIYISHINMIDIQAEAILFDLFYGGQSPTEVTDEDTKDKAPAVPPVTEETPSFRNILISDVKCKRAGRAAFFNGLPEMPIRNVNINGFTVTDAKRGIMLNRIYQVGVHNTTLRTVRPDAQSVIIKNAQEANINGTLYNEVGEKEKIIKL